MKQESLRGFVLEEAEDLRGPGGIFQDGDIISQLCSLSSSFFWSRLNEEGNRAVLQVNSYTCQIFGSTHGQVVPQI